jgi:hypothetical protein
MTLLQAASQEYWLLPAHFSRRNYNYEAFNLAERVCPSAKCVAKRRDAYWSLLFSGDAHHDAPEHLFSLYSLKADFLLR